ncbi:carbon starvation protein [Microbacterium keratanolyticum]|uniref:Carbon starvation protein n=1 Tax=Microbacterium keratanolyticum TaxID=67574 RepID=A0A9W6HPM1_9MICO|nr:carbon starvation CstA family protein [Microbacterium keratanolyticum]MBM7468522.1 carbon starvation protein [Microbacterium keratanolyticum]GLK00597.1 putative carbon starvation protein [Microbacterium keratanolyticum]
MTAPSSRRSGGSGLIDEPEIVTDPNLPPVSLSAEDDRKASSWTLPKIILWVAIALLGAVAWTMLAIVRGETVNAIWFVFAAVCTYLIGYRFYSKVIERYITRPDDRRATPAEVKQDGKDYVPTDRRVLYGHHFAAIAGAGPLVGPVLAAQMGFLPGTIWIIVGVVLAGAVQDYLVLFFSMRRGGRTIGQMARQELGKIGGTAAIIASLLIMLIIVAILALVVVNALGESPWGVFSVSMTIPIALFMGVYLRYLRPGKVTEISIIGFALLMAAIIGGGWVAGTEWGQAIFHLDRTTIAWGIIIYGFIAAVLPVWLLLAPRDYLSTFMKIGVVVMLAGAIVLVRPEITVPAITIFGENGMGPVFAGPLFPFLFVTIACGALSGFHALIASGTTPKLVEKERQTRFIGYGGMLMESFVAIMALVAAISIDQGIYFAMNAPAAATGGTVEGAVAFVNSLGLTGVNLTPEMLTGTAQAVGEESIVSRTGGAPTLALGLAHIMQQALGGQALMAFWYHFAIMFEALFILTAVDAGTRVARFMLQDSLGAWAPKFRDVSWRPGVWICTAIMVAGWGTILILGVTDPLGGINTFFPLFGIANQLLAAIALAVVLAIVAKRGRSYFRWLWIIAVPLAFTAVVTITASIYKIASPVPAIGYWSNHFRYVAARDSGDGSLGAPEVVDAVIRNTAVQGTLSIVFVVLAIIVMISAILSTIKAIRNGGGENTEDAPVASRRYAPAGFLPSAAERELEKQWEPILADERAGAKH